MSMRDKFQKVRSKKLFNEIKEHMIMGQFKDALEKINSLDVQYLPDSEQVELRIEAWKIMCITRQGKYQEGLKLADAFIQSCVEEELCREPILDTIIAKSYSYSALGKIDDGLDMCKKAEQILKNLDLTTRENRARLASVLTIQGLNALHQGDLELAIEIYSQSYPILDELGNKKSASAALHNIGSTYRVMGDLDRALEYVEMSKAISEEIEYIPNLAGAYTTTGIIFYQKGQLEKASDNLDKSLEMFRDIGHRVYLARGLYYAVVIAVAQEDLKRADEYLNQMSAINNELDSLLISQHYRVAKALWHKSKGEPTDLQIAHDLFEQVVNEKITFFEVTFQSLLSLSDLLLEQMKSSDSEEHMGSIKEYAEMALEIAVSQGSHWLEAETYCLQAQIALIEIDYEKAKQLLTKAQLIADDKGLHQLARRISKEFDELLRKEERWTEISKSGASVSERLEIAQINERVERMAKIQEAVTPDEEKDQPIQFMLLSAHEGYCIVSKEFETSFKVDESLVSGFLSAITSFSDEVFSLPLDRIKVGEFILLFRAIMPFLFCYVFKGESYSALKKVEQIIEYLKEDEVLWMSLRETIESGKLNNQVNQEVQRIVTDVFQIVA
ncbi:MAG: tetratricopeptide repeat protein [Candidatus Lokiarchaeota archaeon]|nr:tetratricopeptide repeat protein [Candidatus Lokiarchaeota archaeon]